MKRLLAFSILIVAACLLCAFQQQILTPIFQAPSSGSSPAVLTEDTVAATPTCTTGTNDCNITGTTLTSGDLYIVWEVSTNVGATHTVSGGPTWNAFTGSCHTDAGSKVDICWWWAKPGSTYSSQTVDIHDSSSTFSITGGILGCNSSTGWPASPVDIAGAINDNENFTTTSGVQYTMTAGTTASTAAGIEWVVGLFGVKYGGVPGSVTWAGLGSFTQRAQNVGNAIAPGIQSEDQFTTTTGTYQATAGLTMSSGQAGNYGVGVTLAMKPN